MTNVSVLTVAALGLAGVTTMAAGSSTASLSVGVVVTRSCAVDTGSSALQVRCSTGGVRTLRLSESLQRAESSGAPWFRVASARFPEQDLQLITIDF